MFMAGMEEIPINNETVLNISQTIKAVMSSAAEAKLGALFINAKTAVSIQGHSKKWDTHNHALPSKPTT